MTLAPMQCPRCAGAFQIESTSAGLQVGCPHCGQPVQIPPIEAWEQPSEASDQPPAAPPVESPSPAQTASGAGNFALNCPHCRGEFQITSEMSGMQVACPHCQQALQLPDLKSGANAPPPAPPTPATYQAPTGLSPQEAAFMRFPSAGPLVSSPAPAGGGGAPASLPPADAMLPPQKAQPKPVDQSASKATSERDQSHLYPPGYSPPSQPQTASSPPASAARKEKPAAKEQDFAYPPGTEPKPSGSSSRPDREVDLTKTTVVDALLPPGVSTPPATEAKKPKESPPEPVKKESDSQPAAKSADIDSLLPPTTQATPQQAQVKETQVADHEVPAPEPSPPEETGEQPSAVNSPSTEADPRESRQAANTSTEKDSKLDSLLPPTAGESSQPAVELPADWQEASAKPKPADGSVLIPTDDGSYARVYEPRRTVGYGDDEVELRQLTPAEKARRRFIRNLIMWTIGTGILALAMYLLASGKLF